MSHSLPNVPQLYWTQIFDKYLGHSLWFWVKCMPH